MLKIFKFSIILLLVFNIFSIGVLTVSAAQILPNPTGPGAEKCPAGTNCGNYTLNDMARTAITISEFILGIVGSLALLAFVAGGLMWMLSAGNPEWVTRGKQTILGAVIGLVIVFTSYMIIQLVYTALDIKKAEGGKWSTSNWFNSP